MLFQFALQQADFKETFMLPKNSSRLMTLLLAVMLLLVVMAGFAFYKTQEKKLRKTVENQFVSIAMLKAEQISDWRKTKINEVLGVIESPFFKEPAQRIMSSGSPEDSISFRFLMRLVPDRSRVEALSFS